MIYLFMNEWLIDSYALQFNNEKQVHFPVLIPCYIL